MWYSAKLLFETEQMPDDNRVLQEESIRLIQADDEQEAASKAKLIGTAEQHEYTNSIGELVTWRFVSVVEVQDLCEDHLSDGIEVFSSLKWKNLSSKDEPIVTP
jgi:Domain of unknown function (DUF4288)